MESKFDDEQYQVMKAMHLAHFIELEKKNEGLEKRVKELSEMVKNREEYWICSLCKEAYSFGVKCIMCDNCCAMRCPKCVGISPSERRLPEGGKMKYEGLCALCNSDIYCCSEECSVYVHCGECGALCCEGCETTNCGECKKPICHKCTTRVCSCEKELCSKCVGKHVFKCFF